MGQISIPSSSIDTNTAAPIKINTNGKDQIAGGIVYKADKFGIVEIPDEVAQEDGLIAGKPKRSTPKAKTSLNVLSPKE